MRSETARARRCLPSRPQRARPLRRLRRAGRLVARVQTRKNSCACDLYAGRVGGLLREWADRQEGVRAGGRARGRAGERAMGFQNVFLPFPLWHTPSCAQFKIRFTPRHLFSCSIGCSSFIFSCGLCAGRGASLKYRFCSGSDFLGEIWEITASKAVLWEYIACCDCMAPGARGLCPHGAGRHAAAPRTADA